MRKNVVTGNWDTLPVGCSVQSGGDWAVHYNNNNEPNSVDMENYTPVNVTSSLSNVLSHSLIHFLRL